MGAVPTVRGGEPAEAFAAARESSDPRLAGDCEGCVFLMGDCEPRAWDVDGDGDLSP